MQEAFPQRHFPELGEPPGGAAAHSAAEQLAVLVEAPEQLPMHRYSGRTSARVC
jgi:hypothetical protein